MMVGEGELIADALSFLNFLILDIKPAFIQPPEDTTVTEGMTAVLTCAVSGAPKPAISWKKGTRLLSCCGKAFPPFLVCSYYWDSADPFGAYFFISRVPRAGGLLWGCCEPVAWTGCGSLLEEAELLCLIRAAYATLITLLFSSVFQETGS